MGFFSWHTNDTDEPIWNVHTGKHKTAYMIDNKGNSWREDEYDGYGDFGGKDFYELLAEMNGLPSCRNQGLSLAFHRPPKPYLSPNLVTRSGVGWRDVKPRDHVGQGFHTYEEDEA
jgi:hypothetical protein